MRIPGITDLRQLCNRFLVGGAVDTVESHTRRWIMERNEIINWLLEGDVSINNIK